MQAILSSVSLLDTIRSVRVRFAAILSISGCRTARDQGIRRGAAIDPSALCPASPALMRRPAEMAAERSRIALRRLLRARNRARHWPQPEASGRRNKTRSDGSAIKARLGLYLCPHH